MGPECSCSKTIYLRQFTLSEIEQGDTVIGRQERRGPEIWRDFNRRRKRVHDLLSDTFTLPRFVVTKRARALSATVSDTIISILNDSSWSCAEPDSLKMLCDAIIDHDYKGPIDTVEFQGSPGDHERELVIAWEAVPRTCRVRPLAAHAAHFWIRADVEHRVIALALFLLWFRHVYGAHPRVNGFGVDRVGFIILNHGIAGVILCDHTIDPSSGIRFYGMGPPRAICVGRRVYNACSADQDVSETDLNSSVKFMTTYSKILGYQRAEPIRTVEEQVLTDFTANRFDVRNWV